MLPKVHLYVSKRESGKTYLAGIHKIALGVRTLFTYVRKEVIYEMVSLWA